MSTALDPASIIHPWRRYFARVIDLFLMALAAYLTVELLKARGLLNPIAAFALANPLFFDAGVCFGWILIEYLLLRTLGNTPGKALLGLQIKPSGSESRLLLRGIAVWLTGMGAGLPIATQFCNLASHIRLRNQRRTGWDAKYGFTVAGGPLGWLNKVLAALLVLAGIGCIVLQQLRWNEIQFAHAQWVSALDEGRHAAYRVEKHYRQQGKMPASLQQLAPASSPERMKTLFIDPNSGSLHIRAALPGQETRRLFLIPHPASDQKLRWECRSDEVPIEYLPAGCEFKSNLPAVNRGPLPLSASPQPR
jgi:hypothetical protein